jgi:hypothetical protein
VENLSMFRRQQPPNFLNPHLNHEHLNYPPITQHAPHIASTFKQQLIHSPRHARKALLHRHLSQPQLTPPTLSPRTIQTSQL